jgi:hypothetical protein
MATIATNSIALLGSPTAIVRPWPQPRLVLRLAICNQLQFRALDKSQTAQPV